MWRHGASPILFRLAPSIHPSWRSDTAPQRWRTKSIRLAKQQHRPFLSTARRRTQSKSSSSAADLDSLQDLPQPNTSRPVPSSSSPEKASGEKINRLLDSTFRNRNSRQPRPPRESTASMAENSFRASQASQASQTSRTSDYYSQREQRNRSKGSIAGTMNFPTEIERSTSEDPNTAQYHDSGLSIHPGGRAKRNGRTIRSRPTLGRTVEIDPERGLNFGRALRQLEIQCAKNKVRTDLARQRYHERPGMKRKRLKSQRWRELFKQSFRATVKRVSQMRRKGW